MTDQEFSDHVLQLQMNGFTVLPGMLTSDECDEAQGALERLVEEERDLPHAPVGPHGVQIYNLLNKGRVFERVYQIPPLLRVIRHFLGDDAVLSSTQAHIVFPGAPDQGLHSDGSQTGPNQALSRADGDRRITSHVLAFNVVFCISDYTRQNGATRIVPGSHKVDPLAVPHGRIPGEFVVAAERGSVVMFNISTWHGSSEHTGDAPRYAVMTPWRRRWLRAEVDLGRMVHPDVLARAGEEGPTIFGIPAREPYVDRWKWDWSKGQPKPEWQ
ncbi:MAG: phytanoyl-CoA dioxygenase family protein [Candidatus Poribacteria bacterium]